MQGHGDMYAAFFSAHLQGGERVQRTLGGYDVDGHETKKPILLLALEEYFRNPTIDTLADLYTSVNNMDLSAMPQLSYYETQVLAASDNKDMFIEKFEEALERVQVSSPNSSVRNVPMIHAGEGAQQQQQQPTYFDIAPGGAGGAKKVINKLPISRDSHEFETKVMYGKTPVPIKVPVAVLPETVGDVRSAALPFCITPIAYKFSVLDRPAHQHLPWTPRSKSPTFCAPPAPHHQWALHPSNHRPSQRPLDRKAHHFPRPRQAVRSRCRPRSLGVRPCVRRHIARLYSIRVSIYRPEQD